MNTYRILLFTFILFLLQSCYKGKTADLVIYNARIHTMADNGLEGNAIAIKDGKILEVGPERQIRNKYAADEELDAGGRDLYPGLTDAHTHLIEQAKKMISIDLSGCKSYEELIVRIEKFSSRTNKSFLIGYGWDESLWVNDSFPTNAKLSKRFPKLPVCLYRVDGHTMLVNDFLLEKCGINASTQVSDGSILIENGKPTGILIDGAMTPVENLFPPFKKEELEEKLIELQGELLQYGIIGVHEAGITYEDISLLKNLMNNDAFELEIYAMLYPETKTIAFAKKSGIFRFKNLTIRSFKLMADGALGSRGAFLKHPYSDANHSGKLTITRDELSKMVLLCSNLGYQLNTHAIGDSTVRLILDQGKSIFERQPDHRWRIEHAQVIDPTDFQLFSSYGFFPSVQPCHLASDYRWAEKRLGSDRLKGAYAYKTLLEQFGMIAIGTDYPVEPIDPFRNLHAAVNRKNEQNLPENGFLKQEAITVNDFFAGMTKWAAFAAFRENETGTLEKGKNATFVIFDQSITESENYQANFAWKTFIKGKCVYDTEDL